MRIETILSAKGGRTITSPPDALIINVVERMQRENIGALVICANDRHILGIISEKDIVRSLSQYGEELPRIAAHHVMVRTVKTCSPKDSLKEVMKIMTTMRLRHVPVVDGEGLRGIISLGDIVKYLLSEMEMEVNVLRDMCLASGYGSIIPNQQS